MVHNNWIVGLENKIYRAKELHQWMNDENQYYSSLTRKYLAYKNYNNSKKEEQMELLETAFNISKALNRILILPQFYKMKTASTLLQMTDHIEPFDKKHRGVYREHSFLSHPLVPSKVKQSVESVELPTDDVTAQDLINKWSNINAHILEVDVKILQEKSLWNSVK